MQVSHLSAASQCVYVCVCVQWPEARFLFIFLKCGRPLLVRAHDHSCSSLRHQESIWTLLGSASWNKPVLSWACMSPRGRCWWEWEERLQENYLRGSVSAIRTFHHSLKAPWAPQPEGISEKKHHVSETVKGPAWSDHLFCPQSDLTQTILVQFHWNINSRVSADRCLW